MSEQATLEGCDTCQGKGTITKVCPYCSGSGQGRFSTYDVCARCKGQGDVQATCPSCKGTGISDEQI